MEVKDDRIHKDFAPLLIEGEDILKAFKSGRDYSVFTSKRLILVDKQGITGSKKEYKSIPYKSMTGFSVETAGTFDLDIDIKIYGSGLNTVVGTTVKPYLELKVLRDSNPMEIQQLLANFIL